MKPDNWNRFAAGLLAILLCLCSFSMPAFASGTDPAPEPLPEIIEEEPTTGGMEPEGVPITPKGNATLDTIESGKMTKDLALITSLKDVQVLNSKEFILAVKARLDELMA